MSRPATEGQDDDERGLFSLFSSISLSPLLRVDEGQWIPIFKSGMMLRLQLIRVKDKLPPTMNSRVVVQIS